MKLQLLFKISLVRRIFNGEIHNLQANRFKVLPKGFEVNIFHKNHTQKDLKKKLSKIAFRIT